MRILSFPAQYAPEIKAVIDGLVRDVKIDMGGEFPGYIGADRRDESRVGGTIYLLLVEPNDGALDLPLVELPRRAVEDLKASA